MTGPPAAPPGSGQPDASGSQPDATGASAEAEVVRVSRDRVPASGCIAVGPADEVLLTGVEGEVRAYVNRCLHVGRRMHDGIVRDGVLTCPHHLWRYRVDDGRAVAGGAAASGESLTALPVEVVGEEVRIALPALPRGSLREQLLARARALGPMRRP